MNYLTSPLMMKILESFITSLLNASCTIFSAFYNKKLMCLRWNVYARYSIAKMTATFVRSSQIILKLISFNFYRYSSDAPGMNTETHFICEYSKNLPYCRKKFGSTMKIPILIIGMDFRLLRQFMNVDRIRRC